MCVRDLLAAVGLVSASLLIGCADNRRLDAGSSTASWLDNPAQFPFAEEMHIVCMESTTASFEEETNAVPLRSANITFTEGGSICSVLAAPACTAKSCTATITIGNWGICVAKVTGVTLDQDETLSTCWYHAMFLGSADMKAQQADIDAAMERCKDEL